MKRIVFICGVSLCVVGIVSAQENSGVAFNIGGGFTTPLGNTGHNLDAGWNVQGGLGYNFNRWVGALIDLDYNRLGVNSTTLGNLGFAGGDLSVFSATLDPIIYLNHRGRFDVYVTGGGGIYHQYQDFTQPAFVSSPFNPFFGFYGQAVVSSYSVNKPGVDGGVGVEMGTKWHGKLFAEARYNRIFVGAYHTDYLPVTFGFRW